MNTESKKEKNVVVLNTPKNLNLKEELKKLAVNSQYYKPLEDSKANSDKMIFLIHQINYWSKVDKVKRAYELHNKNHREMLGVSPNLLKTMIDALIALGLIELVSVACAKSGKSNYYSYINPFNINSEELVNKHFYNVEDSKCPLFIKKWVADGNKVFANEYTNYKKTKVKTEKKSKPNAEVEALKLEVERLKELLKLNNIQFDEISPLEPLKEKDEVVVEEEVKVVVKSFYDEKTDTFSTISNGVHFVFSKYKILKETLKEIENERSVVDEILNSDSKEFEDYIFGRKLKRALRYHRTEANNKVNIVFK